MHSKIGFGTYRISQHNPLHLQALTDAFEAGVRLVDTSTNYMNGDAERAIGKVLKQLDSAVASQINVVSKFGYIQGTTLERVKEGERFDEIVEYAEQCYHCISPEFMRDQLTKSLERLGRESITCYLIHNPEYYILDALAKGVDRVVMLDTMFERIYGAFVALEKEVASGRIESYGISSNSFAKAPDDPEYLPYEDLITLAQNAAKEAGSASHHFAMIQMPVNLLEQEGLKCAAWAKKQGLKVMANRPLNAQHNGLMYRLADYKEPETYERYLNEVLEMTDNVALRKIYNLIGQMDDVKNRFGWVGEYESFLHTQIVPHLRNAISILSQEEQMVLAESLELFLDQYGQSVAHECSKAARVQLKNELKECQGTLQECALNFLLNNDDIDYVLIGMRKPSYVAEVMSIPL